MGEVGAFSFYPTKNLGGFGDGGMVTVQSDELARRIRALRVHGAASGAYVHEEVGLNSRLDAIQAVALDTGLSYLDGWLEQRRSIALRYGELLDHPCVLRPETAAVNRHAWNYYTVRIKGVREEVCRHLEENGIGRKIFYPLPLHLQPCFAALGYRRGDLPESEKAAEEVLSLPIFPGLRDEEVTLAAETLLAGVEKYA